MTRFLLVTTLLIGFMLAPTAACATPEVVYTPVPVPAPAPVPVVVQPYLSYDYYIAPPYGYSFYGFYGGHYHYGYDYSRYGRGYDHGRGYYGGHRFYGHRR